MLFKLVELTHVYAISQISNPNLVHKERKYKCNYARCTRHFLFVFLSYCGTIYSWVCPPSLFLKESSFPTTQSMLVALESFSYPRISSVTRTCTLYGLSWGDRNNAEIWHQETTQTSIDASEKRPLGQDKGQYLRGGRVGGGILRRGELRWVEAVDLALGWFFLVGLLDRISSRGDGSKIE
jgi:hypothetical protein